MTAPDRVVPRDAALPSLLAELARTNVKLRLVGEDRLEVTAPTGRLTVEIRQRIAERKPELIEWLARTRSDGPGGTALPVIVPDPERLFVPFPPPDLQMSFLVGSTEGLEYHVRPHQYLELDFERLDPERFETALNEALRRQRANLVVVRPDLLLETVRDPGPVRVEIADLRRLPQPRALAAIEATREAMRRAELPLDRWPWLDVRISRYGADRARLHYNNNNFFSDALGTRRFLDTVMRLHDRPGLPLPELTVSYRDCVLALAELEQSPLGEASRTYWYDRLADLPEAPALPLASGDDPRERSQLHRRELELPKHLWTAFKRRAARHGLTPTNALHGVYAEVLSRWSGSRHFLINNMITHRLPLHPQIDEVIGNLAALYPLEVDWRHDEPFRARVTRLQGRVMADMDHVHWSGVKVLQALNQVRRTPGRAVCPYATGSALGAGLTDRPVHSLLETPQVLLDCELFELNDGALWVVWDVIESMFPEGLIDAMHTGYRSLLTQLAEHDEPWEQRSFDLLPDRQRARRERVNRTAAPVPGGRLHDALPRQAAARAGRPAVISATGTLDYATLHERAAELAGRLRGRGVRPADLAAIVAPKGWEQVVGVFGVLTSGAGYVPVDPEWPEDRIRFLLQDAAVRAVVTVEKLSDRIAALTDVPVLAVDRPASGVRPVQDGEPGDRAYVIYTSGTTGRPKGAVLDHRGPLNTVTDVNRRFGIGPDDVVFGISSLCFDLSVYDLFGTAAAGAALLLPHPARSGPADWAELVREHGVTVWNSVPAIMELFTEEAAATGASFPALRTVLLSGDWIPVTLPERIRAVAPNARVVSLGGATEASIWSIWHPADTVEPGRPSIPYGRPLANQSWYVLDEQGRDAPDWVPGHLHIGGIGVAQGYLGDPDRTAAAFVAHPRTGERLYRTGDLGRYLPGGDIEFLGRADFQVKIQGFRVEPGEVEQTLMAHPGVRAATVIARASGSGKQLAAFAVAAEGPRRPDPAELRGFLSDRLPAYLVPDQVTVLDRLPLTANGKVDRRRLETTEPSGHARRPYRAPGDPVESALVEMWESVLATGPIGVHDDFFEQGGQSFAALRVIGLVAQRWGRRVSLGALLEGPTVAQLARRVTAAESTWSPLVRLRETGRGAPWFLVHPAGGDVMCYRALADRLDAPCYALQAAEPAAGQEPRDEVADLADRYLRALLEVRPGGPYRLGGWSSGAVVAFELARRLELRGETVERLVVVDAPAPTTPREVDEASVLLWFLEDLDLGFRPDGPTPAEISELTADGRDGLDRALALGARHGLSLNRGAGRYDTTGPVPDPGAASDAASLVGPYTVFRDLVRACHRYRPGTVAADMTVLRAADGHVTEFDGHPHERAADWGWAALTSGTVHTRVLAGTHHTLLGARHVDAVAEAIRRTGRTGNATPTGSNDV